VSRADLLVAIAGYGLYPSTRQFADAPLDFDDWTDLLAQLDRGLLLRFAESAADAGALPVTETQRKDLRAHTKGAEGRRDAAGECIDEVVSALDRQSIESCIIRGAATSAFDYEPSALRLYESVHVLVPPEHEEAAESLLEEQGILLPGEQRSWSRRRRLVSHTSRNGVPVRIHSSFAPKGIGGTVPVRDLFANRVRFTPRRVRLGALGSEERLLAACVQARLDPPGHLLAQRDVVQLTLNEELSLRRVESLASAWRLEAVLAEAVNIAWTTFSVPDVVPISAWSRAYRPHRRDRRRLEAHPSPVRDPSPTWREPESVSRGEGPG
jgi:Uncharacterised nucleotidyltransferase